MYRSKWPPPAFKFGSWQRAGVRAATVLLGVLIGGELAHRVYVLRAPTAPTQVSPASVRAASRFDLQGLMSASLFGRAPMPERAGVTAADMRRALVLSGTIAMPDPHAGFAILGEKGKPTHLYHAGADLEGIPGGHLHEVYDDYVVIEVGGQRQRLQLPYAAGLRHGKRAVGALLVSTRGSDPDPPGEDVRLKPIPPGQSAFDDLHAVNFSENGQFAGMVLHPSKHYQRQYGIHEGDRLTAVNGVAITDPDQLTDLLKDAGKSLNLSVIRNGAPRELSLAVEN